jgi:hypothetical protein
VEHPSEETLKRFVAGSASRDESRAVVAHLLKGCYPCARKIRALMQPDAVQREGYDPALERFDEGLVEGLESSISPMQALRSVLKGRLDDGGSEPPPGRKPPRRDD